MNYVFTEFSPDKTKLENTISSIQKVDDIFIVSYYDEYDQKLEWLHNYFLDHKDTIHHLSGCSIFSVKDDSGKVFFGRNFDDNNCSILLGKYSAPGKYKSFSFSRLEDMRFNINMRIEDFSQHKLEEFLHFPFFANDGMNEHGLAVGIASVEAQEIIEIENREPIFLTLFVRRILDVCRTVDEVINFSNNFYIYDNTLKTNANHLLISDAAGNNLVIEYVNGKMYFIKTNSQFEIITNYPVYGKSVEEKIKCWRYDSISDDLNDSRQHINSLYCMDVLEDVYNGTTWSVVFNLKNTAGVFAKYGDYNKLYSFRF